MSLGLPHQQTYLVDYDPEWPSLFEEERARLRAALPADALDIQHVGSTAVPGLRAKPIIDVAVAARSHALAGEWQEAMAVIGYDYPGDIGFPNHRIYGRDPTVRLFLVHVVDADGEPWKRFIHFRDRLRSDPRLAAEYEAIKLDAAARFPTGTRANYSSVKAGFIESVLSGA